MLTEYRDLLLLGKCANDPEVRIREDEGHGKNKSTVASASVTVLSRINLQQNDGIAIQRNHIRRATIVDSPALIRGSIAPNRQHRDRNEPRECQ
jgi:hypothetical protein